MHASPSLHSVHGSGSLLPPGLPGLPALESLLYLAFGAYRTGGLPDLLAQRPRAVRWMLRRLRPLIESTWGAAAPPLDQHHAAVCEVVLHWLLSELRPDRCASLDGIQAEAWLSRTSWRPLLSLACHYGFLEIPRFPGRYLGADDEAVVERLCTLWDVGPSTLYRYLDKGRRQLAQTLTAVPFSTAQRWALRTWAVRFARRGSPGEGASETGEWHLLQAAWAQGRGLHDAALWHLLQAAAWDRAVELLGSQANWLAAHPDTDAAVLRLQAAELPPALRVRLSLARAELSRTRSHGDQERHWLEKALGVAVAQGLHAHEGRVLLALGNYCQSRDLDRALAYYQQSAELLSGGATEPASESDAEPADWHDLRVQAHDRLAWIYTLRNDPRARVVLDAAEALRSKGPTGDATNASLANTWGEYWRRAGDTTRELEHKHRALVLYERLGDSRQVLSACNNLSMAYCDRGDHDRAVQYGQKVVDHARTMPVEPYLVTCALGNVGAAQFWRGDYDRAIDAYAAALKLSGESDLSVHVTRTHYNLAEAYYKRFQAGGNPSDEREGDRHVAAVLEAKAGEHDPYMLDAARKLKGEVMGSGEAFSLARLVPDEHAAHAVPMAEIQGHREALALPGNPENKVRAHLAIARAYLAIANAERDVALALMHEHGLQNCFSAELDALRSAFTRELTREQQVQARWRERAGELLAEQRRIAVLEHLFNDGSIQKSTYARLCGVGPATASKHLVTLAGRGLLTQMGKGPSTRYLLADGENGALPT